MGSCGHFTSNTLIDAGFVLYRKNKSDLKIEFLLLQKSKDSWGSAKGHVEEDESEYETAVRKAKEEMNLEEGKDFTTIPDFKHGIGYEINNAEDGHKMYLVNLWLGEIISTNCQVKLSTEYQGYKWVDLDNAIEHFGTNPRDKCWIACLKRCSEIIEETRSSKLNSIISSN